MNALAWRPIASPVEQRQHLDAAVSAPGGNKGGDGRILPRPEKRGGSHVRRAGDVSLACENAVLVDGLEPERPDLGDPGVEFLTLERAGGRYHGDPVAGPQRAGLAHRLGEPRHLGRDRLMLVAAERRAQRRAAERLGPCRREEPLL